VGPQVLLPPGAGLVLEQVQLCGEIVHLLVRLATSGACCPLCACWSDAVHSSYHRKIADLPIADRQVVVRLHVRRFRCREPTCLRCTFVEQVPSFVERYARRTRRLRADLEEIGLALGGRPGSRLSASQRKPTSRMTVLRLLRALPEPPIETPRVLGVMNSRFGAGAATARFSSMAPTTTSSTCSRTHRPTRWSSGCGIIQVWKSSAATEMASTPVPPPAALQVRCKSQTGGTSSTTSPTPWSEWRCVS
jgi:hypothetical protein